MNPDLLSSLISARSGLAGAVIGVIGALIATRHASKTAFAQVRYGIQQERISEVLNTTYDRLGGLFSQAMLLSVTRGRSRLDEGTTQYFENSQKLYLYQLRNQLWMPLSISQKAKRIHGTLENEISKISELLEDRSLT